MRKLILLFFVGLALIGYGCSDANPDAPVGGVTHPMDSTFLAGDVHGPVAKADLTYCQRCHAEPGGAGSNPRFNVGIDSVSSTGCENAACHPVNSAHPQGWAGPNNNTFHYSAGNIQGACTLCHGIALDGAGGAIGAVSCLDCHATPFDGTLDCISCHGTPPAGIVNHVSASGIALHDECTICHGMKESVAGGSFYAVANYALFNYSNDTYGDHWNNNINMNGPSASDPAGGAVDVGAGYNSVTFACDNAGCHGSGNVLSSSGLPVEFGDYGTGGSHEVGQSWLLPSGHVAVATVDCLNCHAQTGASPTVGAPACQDCHLSGDPLSVPDCASCHTEPPSLPSIVAGDRPDRAGSHAKHDGLTVDTTSCMACHDGGGTGSLTHFDRSDSITPNYPADVQFLGTTYDAQGGAALYNAGVCQNVICHGGVATPDWLTGSIDVYGGGTAGCQQCHESSGEYNAYSSGRHNKHVGDGFSCTACHDVAVLQTGVAGESHFSGLATQGFELDPADTINSGLGYNGSTCSTAGCHGASEGSW